MAEEKDDELCIEDPWLLAELEKESDSITDSWSTSNGFSQTVITLRMKGEECCRVVSNSLITTDNISNPIDMCALARAVANSIAQAFYEKLTKKILPIEAEKPSFDLEKFQLGLPEFVPLKPYTSYKKLRGRENYWEWVRMITADLQENNLHLWIQSRCAESTGLPTDVRLRYDNQVQQILYASIETKLHTFLVQFDSAWEVFNGLEERFGRQKTKDVVDLFNRLENIQVRPRQDMAQFLAHFADLREEFRVRFPGLDDLFFCAKLLLKLKPWYPAVVQTLFNAPKDGLTFDLIRERILAAERVQMMYLKARLRQQQRNKPRPFQPSNFNGHARQSRAGYVKRSMPRFSESRAKKGFAEPRMRRQWRPPFVELQPRSRLPFEPSGRANFCDPQQRTGNRPKECFGCGQRGHFIAACPNANAKFCNRRNPSVHIDLPSSNVRMTFETCRRRGFLTQKYHCNDY